MAEQIMERLSVTANPIAATLSSQLHTTLTFTLPRPTPRLAAPRLCYLLSHSHKRGRTVDVFFERFWSHETPDISLQLVSSLKLMEIAK